MKEGAAFYDSETTPFGLCGETEQPTESSNSIAPSGVQTSSSGNGESGESSYKCLPESLIDEGYDISINKCDLFENCFNQYIGVGDDWFCKENEQCVGAPSCGENKSPSTAPLQAEPTRVPTQVSLGSGSNSPTVDTIPQRPTESNPKPSGLQITPTNMMNDSSTTSSLSPTETETLLPTTFRPTSGPCSGMKCYQDDHCRSQFGFCGPGETYCNENPIWTKDCPTNDVPIDSTTAPTTQPSTETAFSKPAFSKPGGNGSITKPARTHSPMTNYPSSWQDTNAPSSTLVAETEQSSNPTSTPTELVFTIMPVTLSPTLMPSFHETDSSGE